MEIARQRLKRYFERYGYPVKDDLQKFHEQNMADEQYAIARQLLDLGDAVARLREERHMTAENSASACA